MRNYAFFIISILFTLQCGKEKPPCSAENTLVDVIHHNSIICQTLANSGFIIRSEEELKKLISSYKCYTFNDYVEPLSFKNEWMIGYSTTIDYYKSKTSGSIEKDTCLKSINYKFVLSLDTTSQLRDPNNKAFEIRYCIISSFPSDYKVIYTKEIRYEKLP